jgi:flagellar assembly factor FliW
LLGLENCRHWVLLADAYNEALGWLQSTSRPDIALAVVSPRRFVPYYQLRVARSELTPLALRDIKQAEVLAIVGRHEQSMTLNLKAPLVINLEQRLGRQVVSSGDQPVQYLLEVERVPLRKSA